MRHRVGVHPPLSGIPGQDDGFAPEKAVVCISPGREFSCSVLPQPISDKGLTRAFTMTSAHLDGPTTANGGSSRVLLAVSQAILAHREWRASPGSRTRNQSRAARNRSRRRRLPREGTCGIESRVRNPGTAELVSPGRLRPCPEGMGR